MRMFLSSIKSLKNKRIETRSGGEILVEQLLIHGVHHAFGVPGESYLPVLDALYAVQDRLGFVTCRHEAGAANMAEAYGKLTSRPGVCFVTRGPGATHAAIGVHTAFQDSTPMVLFVGQVGSDVAGREAFQEIDYRQMFAPIAKWVGQIDRVDRIPEIVSRAFHTAVSGRPGPVVLALPEDALTATSSVSDAGSYQRVQSYPGLDQLAKLQAMLQRAKSPILLLGGGGWTFAACKQIQIWVERTGLPVATSFRRQDLFDNRHPQYIGDVGIGINPQLAARIKASDCLIVLGPRLGEMTTSGYSLIDIPVPRQHLVHIHAGADELGRVYQGGLLINASMPAFAEAIGRISWVVADPWRAWLEQGRAEYLSYIQPTPMPGSVNLSEIMVFLRTHLPENAILTNGAGNYTAWIHRFYQYRGFRTQLAPTSGAMGYGVPAAIAAKLLHPDRMVLAWAGDGCFLMNSQELATAQQYGVGVIFLVVNNGMYGTIRMHQERHYPGRVYGTELQNPNFVALAQAYGLKAARVDRTEDFAPIFKELSSHPGPSLIELSIDPEAITPRTTLSAIRQR